MKTPDFWSDNNLLSRLLTPFGWLYGMAAYWRFKFCKPYHADCPVICVGNLTAGGSGKTPVSLSMAQILKKSGKNPFFLTRGYGGKLKNVIVNPQIHSPQDVGDEPLLLTAKAPTVVNPNRAIGAQTACNNGADCIIMDDGFQNPTLYKNLSFLVFDGTCGMGNEKSIPAGPLRESFKHGIKRAQAAIIIGKDRKNLAKRINLPIFKGQIEEVKTISNKREVLAFAGIGRPQKLYSSLEKCGLKVAQTIDFPDHHYYTRDELKEIINIAKKNNFDIYTTSKDFVKIPTDLQSFFKVLQIQIVWEDEKALTDFIKQYIK